ncbi:MAG: asparagine synthase (glutamine-hydrolyzing) [Niabella sp.]|nr:asparagine synthase (glutamine-hydrolyzing) [Niabella sp.]
MCGITGFIDGTKDRAALIDMTNALERRGPDDQGVFFADGVGMGHRRLSIIDLSNRGHQPMFFGNLVIVFNGEIYNYRDIQKELIAKNYVFESESDTEVVLKAFHCWGINCVQKFVGMFAIALYDKVAMELYLIRDRVGVKPLYYAEGNKTIAFSSDLNGINQYLFKKEKSVSNEALSSFLSLGYIVDNSAIYKGVKRVPPGCYLHFKDGQSRLVEYWSIAFAENKEWENRKDDDVLDELEHLIVEAFKYRMVADVPVGVFLSSGVDSSLVAAVLARHYGKIKTFTVGFKDARYDESSDAKKIADYLGTDHKEMILTPEFAFDILDHFYDIYDEPHGDTSCIPTTFVSQLAKESGAKVVLSADGGDELFGGYVRYTEYLNRWGQIARNPKILNATAEKMLRIGGAFFPGRSANRMGRFADIMGADQFSSFYQRIIRNSSVSTLRKLFPQYVEPLQQSNGGDTLLNKMCEWDLKHYLTNNNLIKVDRATMFNSIEGREPFLDHRLIEFAAKLPGRFKIRNGVTKYILKKLLARYLPVALFDLPKRGFSVPLQQWIRKHYNDQLVATLKSPAAMFNRKEVSKLINQRNAGSMANEVLLWYIFSFHLWLQSQNK